VKRHLPGGSPGNEQLTALIAIVLVVLLAAEGARMLRYYLRGEDYVQRGPPHAALRVLVAPVLVASTLVLFATGVALLVLGQSHGTVVGLHKAAFVVWVGAAGVHVLVHVPKLRRALSQRIPGAALRAALVAATVLGGAVPATATLPAADRLQDQMFAQVGVDAR
jgi:hypothetical protein